MTTLNEYLAAAANPPQAQRFGQWAYNTLVDFRPDLAEKVRGTLNDPFYRDERLPAFYVWLAAEWDN